MSFFTDRPSIRPVDQTKMNPNTGSMTKTSTATCVIAKYHMGGHMAKPHQQRAVAPASSRNRSEKERKIGKKKEGRRRGQREGERAGGRRREADRGRVEEERRRGRQGGGVSVRVNIEDVYSMKPQPDAHQKLRGQQQPRSNSSSGKQ